MFLYRPQQFFFLGSSIRSVHFPYRCLDVENSFHRNEQLNVRKRKDLLKKNDKLFHSHKKGFFKKIKSSCSITSPARNSTHATSTGRGKGNY